MYIYIHCFIYVYSQTDRHRGVRRTIAGRWGARNRFPAGRDDRTNESRRREESEKMEEKKTAEKDITFLRRGAGGVDNSAARTFRPRRESSRRRESDVITPYFFTRLSLSRSPPPRPVSPDPRVRLPVCARLIRCGGLRPETIARRRRGRVGCGGKGNTTNKQTNRRRCATCATNYQFWTPKTAGPREPIVRRTVSLIFLSGNRRSELAAVNQCASGFSRLPKRRGGKRTGNEPRPSDVIIAGTRCGRRCARFSGRGGDFFRSRAKRVVSWNRLSRRILPR